MKSGRQYRGEKTASAITGKRGGVEGTVGIKGSFWKRGGGKKACQISPKKILTARKTSEPAPTWEIEVALN